MEETNTLPQWRKSEFCGSQACIEVASVAADTILIRDSKNPHASPLSFDRAEWEVFVAGVRAGNFDFQ
jgi:hypothetical protein